MDVTPIIPAGRQIVESYGQDGFRITGADHAGAVLVFPTRTLPWTTVPLERLSIEDFRPVVEDGGVEVLLLGCGDRMGLVPSAIRRFLKDAGIGLDPMDTGAACRTYNVLMSEDRRVAAALLPGGGRRP